MGLASGSKVLPFLSSFLFIITAFGSSTGAAEVKKIKIGFAMDTLKEERWQRDRDMMEQVAHAMAT